MDNILLPLISFAAALVGAMGAMIYNRYTTIAKEGAILHVFAQEFMLLFKRCSMYYQLMIEGKVSTSTLFTFSDSAMVTKFAELTANTDVLKAIIQLKADFFQVVRWAERAIITEQVKYKEDVDLPKSAKEARPPMVRPEITVTKFTTDGEAQSRAVTFFMGDLRTEDGSLNRMRYKDYKTNIETILDYLESCFSFRNCFRMMLLEGPHAVFRRRKAVRSFIRESKTTLDERSKKLEELRIAEKKAWEKEGKKFKE